MKTEKRNMKSVFLKKSNKSDRFFILLCHTQF